MNHGLLALFAPSISISPICCLTSVHFFMHGFPAVTDFRLPHVNVSLLEPINADIIEEFL